jgi:uncharacterized protein
MTLRTRFPQRAGSLLGAALLALAIGDAGTDAHAQAPKPSFNCTKARTADEQTICHDARLAELDRTVALAYARVPANLREGAKGDAKELVAARAKCADDRLCILEQQVGAIELFSGLGAPVRVPPWVGAYRLDLVKAKGLPPEPAPPTQTGHCTMTKIAAISTRFGDKLSGTRPSAGNDHGTVVTYENKLVGISYGYEEGVAKSRVGDEVLVCLVSIPQNCPPGDDRGRVYSGTNLRTKGSWQLSDSQHMCGGA